MAFPILPVLLGLAEIAPTIMKYLGAGDKAVAATETIVDVAQVVTGQGTADDALAILVRDPVKAAEFRQKMAEMDNTLTELFLADMQSARQRDMAYVNAGKINHRGNLMFFLAFLIVAALTYAVWDSKDLEEFTKGIVTLLLGRFLGYLDTIYSFEFGTTRSSKDKDKTISDLSGK